VDIGPHGFFIVAAYTATAVVLGGMVLHAVIQHRIQLQALAKLEARGARRRSDASSRSPGSSSRVGNPNEPPA